MLHLSKVAVGCASLDALRQRQRQRIHDGRDSIRTRFRPKRAEALIGGSIFWIIRHRLVARQTILDFVDDLADRKVVIRLAPTLIAVRPCPKRAHQGWRYLDEGAAPADLDGDGDDGMSALPPRLCEELALLALV